MPQAFERFQQNLTLTGVVCGKCNQTLSRLEGILARDTPEGRMRFKYGKNIADFKSMGKSSKLRALSVGDCNNLSSLAGDTTPPEINYQLAIQENNEWWKIMFSEIPQNIEKLKSAKIAIPSWVDSREAVNQLENHSIEYSETSREVLEIERPIDQSICRAIAKIAFNYLAYFNNSETMLQSRFNELRNFILYGKGACKTQTNENLIWDNRNDEYLIMVVDDKPILTDENDTRERKTGHIITTQLNQKKSAIIFQISFFNTMHRYLLKVSFKETIENIRVGYGHFFCHGSKTIVDLSNHPC